LQAGTPVIDLGMTGTFSYTYGSATTTSDAPMIDLDGNLRTGNPDLGVYEFTGTIQEYTVNFEVINGNGSLEASVNGNTISDGDMVEQGANIIFSANPDENYQVLEWTLNGMVQSETGNTFTYYDLQENISVTVEYDIVDNVAQILDNIRIYPNPSHGIITLDLGKASDFGKAEIDITDIAGRTIYRSALDEGQKKIQMDISNHPTGIYFLKVQTKNNTVTEKIIVR
jgi:hypothetical protein